MKGKTKVYTYVAGDLPHRGHKRALEQAKALGDYLIVGVITDKGIAQYKHEPVMSLDERMELIKAWWFVDEVVAQEELDPVPNLIKYKPDILTHGDDWEEDFPGARYMRSIGKKAIRTHYYKGQSTSKIIERIKNSDFHKTH